MRLNFIGNKKKLEFFRIPFNIFVLVNRVNKLIAFILKTFFIYKHVKNILIYFFLSHNFEIIIQLTVVDQLFQSLT